MITIKKGHSGNTSSVTCLASSRSLSPPVCYRGHVTERQEQNERELLERVQEICREYGRSWASQVSISSSQPLPPEAVSLIQPPERAWFVRLQAVEPEQDQPTGQVEVIVVLQNGEVGIILR